MTLETREQSGGQGNEMNIPMSSPDITDLEREAVAAVMRTPLLSMGPEVRAFEKAISDYVGAKHAIAVSSGTAGLHLAVRALGFADGDWVITTPFSFVSSSNVLLYERAAPIFVDVDPISGNIDTDLMAEAVEGLLAGGRHASRWLPREGASLTGQLKGLLPVDVFGQPADYDSIQAIAADHHLGVIEDSCEAIGAQYKGRQAGTLADIGVFAFYPNKQITTAEGAMVVTDKDDLADLIRALRNQGRAPGDKWLDHTHLGFNYRLDEMGAALGRVQMTRLDELLEKREQVAQWYHAQLDEVSGIELLKPIPSTSRMSWFVYVIRLDEGIDRTRVMEHLAERGIPSRPYFTAIHLQPYMIDRFGYKPGDFPVTEALSQRSLALPFSSILSELQVEYVCDHLRQALKA
jgi:dTDP-4-amino-4,6-dideoxygalactose transaminase